MTNKIMKTLEGQEVWTNAFSDRLGERVCVGIEDGKCVNKGKWFKPTAKEIKELFDDYCEQEGIDLEDLEKEFSGK